MESIELVVRKEKYMKVILIVESQLFIEAVLGHELTCITPYLILQTSNPYDALEICEDIKPDLFLFEYRLFYLDGIELYDRLHARKKLSNVPAIILTASSEEDDLCQQVTHRQLYTLQKPATIQPLVEKIEQIFSLCIK